MPKKVYKLTRTPVNKSLNIFQTTTHSQLDYGTMNDLRKIDDYFIELFTAESENIKNLGLDVNDLSLSIAQFSI